MISNVQLPEWAEMLFEAHNYKVVHGGRGGSKSWGFADALVIQASMSPLFILCAREIQLSIKDSSKRVIENAIKRHGLSDKFDVQVTNIKCLETGSEFIFKGLRDVTSMEGLDRVWVEEAANLSKRSIIDLFPTVRKDGSEIWISFNSKNDKDPVREEFINNSPPPGSKVLHINYDSNPYFPDKLRVMMEHDKIHDYDKYRHVWLGEPVVHSEAQVFSGCWRIADKGEIPTPPQGTRFYFGADWGFAKSKTAFTRAWIDGRTLYVDRAVGGAKIEIDKTPALCKHIEGATKWPSIADCARPETISHMKRNGFTRMRHSKKGKGSVEDGITFLRSYDIVIAPEAENMPDDATVEDIRAINQGLELCHNDFAFYKYKQDAQTEEILPIIIKENDDFCDSVRYGMEELMRRERSKGSGAVMVR
mgnify:CR=1 FL=1